MTTTAPPLKLGLTIGHATDIGGRKANADAVRVRYHDGRAGLALVDGIGSDPEVCEAARLAADVASIVAMSRNAQAGIVAAIDSYPEYTDCPNAVGAVVSVEPDGRIEIAHVGDVKVWTLSDEHGLKCWTVDQVVGQHILHLKKHTGLGDEDHAVLDKSFADLDRLAEAMNDYVLNGFVWATLSSASWTPLRPGYDKVKLLLAASDGVHKVLTAEQLAAFVDEHHENPQELADQVVAGAVALGGEHTDNATAAAIRFEWKASEPS